MLSLFKKKKPNVILILIDGARHDLISKVPFYEELKKQSTFFPTMITYAPYTIASLHATFSGMYGNSNGVNGYYKSFGFDKKGCFTLAQYLKGNGYYTETDVHNENVLPTQGFDKVRIYDEFKDDLTARHLEILNQIKPKQPFFLYLDYVKIHPELLKNVIKKYTDFDEEYFKNKESNLKNYLGSLQSSGEYLKAVLTRIKELGLWDDSIIIVFTDHGVSLGDRIGEKAYVVYLYDYTIRCFLYVIGKQFPKGKTINSQIRSIDIMPTILDILDIKEKNGYKPVQGKSFLDIIHGKEEDRIAYSETGGLGGPTPSPEKHNIKSIRTNKWKLIYNETNKKMELYNLEKDKSEINNLAGKEPEIERRLWERLQDMPK